jgi:hypothetical protein
VNGQIKLDKADWNKPRRPEYRSGEPQAQEAAGRVDAGCVDAEGDARKGLLPFAKARVPQSDAAIERRRLEPLSLVEKFAVRISSFNMLIRPKLAATDLTPLQG